MSFLSKWFRSKEITKKDEMLNCCKKFQKFLENSNIQSQNTSYIVSIQNSPTIHEYYKTISYLNSNNS